MKRICIFLSFGVLGAMEHSKKFPKDIYDAINHRDQHAVEYYANAGQVNINDTYTADEYTRTGRWNEISLERIKDQRERWYCCPPVRSRDIDCVCCARLDGVERYTPLYWALKKKDITAARFLIERGARLNTGKCVGILPDYHPEIMKIGTSAAALAMLARRSREARTLLSEVVERQMPLLSGKRSADEALLRNLILLGDIALIKRATENRLIVPLDLLKEAVVGKNEEIVNFVLTNNPDRAAVRDLMPLVRSRAIARTLEAYANRGPLPVPARAPEAAIHLRANKDSAGGQQQ